MTCHPPRPRPCLDFSEQKVVTAVVDVATTTVVALSAKNWLWQPGFTNKFSLFQHNFFCFRYYKVTRVNTSQLDVQIRVYLLLMTRKFDVYLFNATFSGKSLSTTLHATACDLTLYDFHPKNIFWKKLYIKILNHFVSLLTVCY